LSAGGRHSHGSAPPATNQSPGGLSSNCDAPHRPRRLLCRPAQAGHRPAGGWTVKNLTEAQKVVVALKIAKDLNLNHYTREVPARDVNGDPVSPESSKACSWCARGATTKAALYVGLDPDDLSWY